MWKVENRKNNTKHWKKNYQHYDIAKQQKFAVVENKITYFCLHGRWQLGSWSYVKGKENVNRRKGRWLASTREWTLNTLIRAHEEQRWKIWEEATRGGSRKRLSDRTLGSYKGAWVRRTREEDTGHLTPCAGERLWVIVGQRWKGEGWCPRLEAERS